MNTVTYNDLIDGQIIKSLEPVAEILESHEEKFEALEALTKKATEIENLPELIEAAIENRVPQKIEINCAKTKAKRVIESPHWKLDWIINVSEALDGGDKNLFLWGDGATGKTTVSRQAAEALGYEVVTIPRPTMMYDIFGYFDPVNNQYLQTEFTKAFVRDNVIILFDELDRFDPSIITALNEAFANSIVATPSGELKRGKNIVIGTGNTAMKGGNAMYNTALQHDSSSSDRFVFIEVPYNLQWERETFRANPSWTKRCQRLRTAAIDLKLTATFLITPRAMIKGAQLLAAGFSQSEVEQMIIVKGASIDYVNKLYNAAGKPSESGSKVIGLGG